MTSPWQRTQNCGSFLVWHEAHTFLPRASTTAPWLCVQPAGCGMGSPLWQVAQKLFCLWHSAHCLGSICTCMATLGALDGMPSMWHSSHLAEAVTPS